MRGATPWSLHGDRVCDDRVQAGVTCQYIERPYGGKHRYQIGRAESRCLWSTRRSVCRPLCQRSAMDAVHGLRGVLRRNRLAWELAPACTVDPNDEAMFMCRGPCQRSCLLLAWLLLFEMQRMPRARCKLRKGFSAGFPMGGDCAALLDARPATPLAIALPRQLQNLNIFGRARPNPDHMLHCLRNSAACLRGVGVPIDSHFVAPVNGCG